MPTRPPVLPLARREVRFGPEHQAGRAPDRSRRGKRRKRPSDRGVFLVHRRFTQRASSTRIPSRTSGSGARWDGASTGENFRGQPFALGHGAPNPAVPAAARRVVEYPSDQLPARGGSSKRPRRSRRQALLAEAGYPNGFKVPVEPRRFGPDFMDRVQISLKNLKAAGIETELKLKEYGAYIASTIFGKFDKMTFGLREGGSTLTATS